MTKLHTDLISQYIQAAPAESHARLEQVRKAIREVASDATEEMKYGVPAFTYKKMLVGYAGYKRHIGFYPTPAAIQAFEKDLKEYPQAKGSIQFPHYKPLPIDLIKRMTLFRVKQSKEQEVK